MVNKKEGKMGEGERKREGIKQNNLHKMFKNKKIREKKNCCELFSDSNIIFYKSNVTTSRIRTCYTISFLLDLDNSCTVYNIILNFDK